MASYHAIANHRSVQERLLKEIDQSADDQLTYEVLNKMEYLDISRFLVCKRTYYVHMDIFFPYQS